MAEETNKQKTCPGDCMVCSVYQRNYCAATMTRNIQDMVFTLSNEVRQLRERVDALTTNGEILDAPTPIEVHTGNAQ